MKAKQITTYHVKGEAKTWEKALAPEDESKSVKMIESNVINLYPDFEFQTIEGFGGAMTESSAYLLSRMDEETQNQALQDISDRTAFMQDLSACRSTAVIIPLRSIRQSQTRSQTRIWQPSRSTATANMSFRC